MSALTAIAPHEFDKLIGKSAFNRRQLKARGQLAPLIVATPEHRADGLWRDQIFIVADAVILTAIDMLIAAGAKRTAIDHVMHDLQVEIVSQFHDLDDAKAIYLAFAHDGRRWLISSAPAVNVAMKATAEHFLAIDDNLAALGITEAPRVAFYCVPLHEALGTVRVRAAEHDIELPERIWPTPEELDAGADLLAAAIAPRVSPIIEKWQLRHREAAEEGALQ
ncbi:hypothetical protein ACKWRH_21900 [Bradyrhizobium sp. Pa8]|uniref:hypothetical protein n=1 Tax=Bradyrhizobium sp. Pa8 TaxID=3386552 RepID=UPI00403F067F